MQPPADAPVAAIAEHALHLGGLEQLAGMPDDAPSCDSRIPQPVSVAFRRAVRRLRADKEFSPACDVGSGDAVWTLTVVCECVREAYLGRRCGPVSGGPRAGEILERLRRAFVEEIDAQRKFLQAGDLTKALRAFDLVREAMERDESERFVSSLRSAEALDLVVEIAHDMRSPLTAILMLTDMVRRPQPGASDDVQQRQLGLIYSAAFGLNTLVNDVIALARGGDRLIDRELVPFSTSAVVHTVADMLRPIAEDQKLALRVVTPSVDARLGQPIALSRVLLNLASNAFKYTVAGEVSISAIDLCPTNVRFQVADTGPGIPADVMPGLFEPFGKRPGVAGGRRFSQTGLGLAICRKLLRDMGSELQVESAPDRGTRFFFELTLPVADEDDVARAASAALML
jgi:signal transduction histidine kinase